MIKLQTSQKIEKKIINAEETRRFSGSLIMSEDSSCLRCINSTGGLFCV